MFSDIGELPGQVSVDVSKTDKLLKAIEVVRSSGLLDLFVSDMRAYEQALMHSVKHTLPETNYHHLVREQAIGEAIFAEKAEHWFKFAELKLVNYQTTIEQKQQ